MADMPSVAPAAAPAAASKAPAPADPKAAASPKGDKAPVSQNGDNDSWEVQIDGKPVKKSRKEILEAYQLRELSDKKRSEADKTLQEYNKLFQTFKQDPVKFMKATGVDFEGLATQYLAKKAEDAMADPKDLELRKAKQEAELYKKYVEEQKAAQESAKKAAEVAAVRESIHKDIIQAIEESKDLGLPVDEELVIAIAQKMMLQDMKQKPLNAKEALPKAYASTQKWLQGMASKMEGEHLVKWLGNDVANKIRKYDLAQLKAKRAAPAAPQSLVQPKKDNAPQKQYKTWSQFKAEKLDTIK